MAPSNSGTLNGVLYIVQQHKFIYVISGISPKIHLKKVVFETREPDVQKT